MTIPRRPTRPNQPGSTVGEERAEGPYAPVVANVKDGDLREAMELNEFMTQVGVLMRLPTRDTKAIPTIPAPRSRRLAKGASRQWLPMLATTLVLALVGSTWWPEATEEMPLEVRGAWETTDPRYVGRRLVIDAFAVRSVADSSTHSESVERVEVERRVDTLAIVISHGDAAPRQEIAMSYVRSPRERLMLRNPAGVTWTRVLAGRGDDSASH